MKSVNHAMLLTVLLAGSAGATGADEAAVPDTSAWTCQFCTQSTGASHEVNFGVGYISEDSFKFGEYNGLHEQGAYVIGDLVSDYRNYKNAAFWGIDIADLGLESRSIALRGGKQGAYRVDFLYSELPHYLSDTASTPFRGSGNARLTLPADWVYAGSTTGMTTLNQSLTPVDLETKRTRMGLGAVYLPAAQWETSVKFRQETNEGKRRIAGSFYFNAVELVEPVDYTTNLVDASAAYTGKTWQAKLAYHGSTFTNQNTSLTWQNPYAPLIAGADQGELALPPDNQFHQLSAAMQMQLGGMSRLIADVAVGRLTQDANFLAATRNANLSVSSPPADSLQGQVDTVNANVKWFDKITDSLVLNAAYQYTDRDNTTPQNSFAWVVTDDTIAIPRTNLPYSYTSNKVKLSGEYQFIPTVKSALGYDYEQFKRSYQEVEQSREQSLWASVVSRSVENADITLKLAHANRKKDGYQVIVGVDNPENPLLRKYNMADRDRDSMGMRMDLLVSESSTLGLTVDMAQDDYPGSSLGLTSSKESHVGIDASARVAKNTNATFFVSQENITSSVSGSQLYNIADWTGKIDDSFATAGIGVIRTIIKDKLDVGLDYTYAQSRGKVWIAESGSRLPDLMTKLYSAKLYANYRFTQALALNGTYWYENYATSDWALDDVAENTIANDLSLGQESPSYRVNAFMLAMRYSF